MNKYDIIQYNINPQPIPSIYNDGYSQYETLTKLLVKINELIENQNTGADEIEELKVQKVSLEYYLNDLANNRKLSPTGDFTGTLNGMPMSFSNEGLATDWNNAKGTFGSVTDRLNNSDDGLSTSVLKLNFLDELKLKFMYNVNGDGTNETVKIQNAINDLTDGSTLIFPKGEYIVDQINLTGKNNITIIGYGAILKGDKVDADAILNINNVKNIKIFGLTFNYVNSPTTYIADKAYCIKCTDYAYVNIEHVVFEKMSLIGLYVNQAKDIVNVTGGTMSTPLRVTKSLFKANTIIETYEHLACGIYLGADGEYCVINNNDFMGTYSAIHGVGGANTIFSENTIMGSPATFNALSSLVYFIGDPNTSGLNSGKVIIRNNRINHNNGGATAIYCLGDRNREQRRFTIESNHILIHGNQTNARCIYLKNGDGTILTNNYTIPSTTVNSEGCANITISDSTDVVVDNNTMQNTYGIIIKDNSKVVIGRNTMLTPLSGALKIYSLDTSTLSTHSGIYNFRFSPTAISSGETDVGAWTMLKNVVGDYTITHNLNTLRYTVVAVADNSSTPNLFAVTRSANSFNIKCYNVSGVLTDPTSGVMGILKINVLENANI